MAAPAQPMPAHADAAAERPRTAADTLEQRRRKASMAIADADSGYDVALLSEAEFLERAQLRRERSKRIQLIIDQEMHPNVHYRRAEGSDLPFLMAPGAELLRSVFRYSARALERSAIETIEYASATVLVGICGPTGLLLATRLGHCNSRDPWVRELDGDRPAGAAPVDARERLHTCFVRAETRASILGTREACGATAHFMYPEELATALGLLARVADDAPLTETQVKALRWDAALLGIRTTTLWRALLREALGAEIAQQLTTPTQAQGAQIAALLAARRQAKATARTSGAVPRSVAS